MRYATAVFELAKEAGKLDAIERDVDVLAEALAVSPEFGDLIKNPIYSREELARAMLAVGEKLGLDEITRNTLGLMASKRRLFVLPKLLDAVREMIARDKGIVAAEVVAAKALTKAQQDKLAKALKEAVGKDVKIKLAVDESLIGGLVVKVGSKMVDSSIRTQLAKLSNAMKEVG